MGRGRAKAKQTKVARELKYGGVNTDLSALQAELTGSAGHTTHAKVEDDVDDDEDDDDLYSKYIDDEDDDDLEDAR